MLELRSSHLVNNTIPGEPGIVHDNVDFAIAELGGFLYQLGDIVAIKDIADDGEGAAGLGGVDRVSDGVGFLCLFVRYVGTVKAHNVDV